MDDEDFQDYLDNYEEEFKKRPFFEKMGVYISRYFRRIKWKTKDIISAPRRFWQRGLKGYCSEDLFDVGCYIAPLIGNMIKEFLKDNMTFPGNEEFPTAESWEKELNKIADAFLAWNDLDEMLLNGKTYDELVKETKKAQKEMKKFIDYIGWIWD